MSKVKQTFQQGPPKASLLLVFKIGFLFYVLFLSKQVQDSTITIPTHNTDLIMKESPENLKSLAYLVVGK